MVRPIITDTLFLRQKSTPATAADRSVAQDLLDTLQANADRCVGMAANMIGVNKRIIVVAIGPISVAMLNPAIAKRSGTAYEAQEGCLSLSGTRPAKRYPRITVSYEDMQGRKQRQEFSGFTAQIIQHEMDHLEGILI